MSEDPNTQTAVDTTKTPAEPGVEGAGARDDGDELQKFLAEFDEGTKPPPEPARPATNADTVNPDLKALAEEVSGLRTERQKEVFRRDMDAMVKNVRGDINSELFDDTLVEAWIDAQARQDERLLRVFGSRHDNPKQFQKLVETLGRSFAKKYGKLPDRGATEDREAVTAAVRGTSTRVPEGKAPDMSRMSPQEFQAEKDRLFDR